MNFTAFVCLFRQALEDHCIWSWFYFVRSGVPIMSSRELALYKFVIMNCLTVKHCWTSSLIGSNAMWHALCTHTVVRNCCFSWVMAPVDFPCLDSRCLLKISNAVVCLYFRSLFLEDHFSITLQIMLVTEVIMIKRTLPNYPSCYKLNLTSAKSAFWNVVNFYNFFNYCDN